MKETGTRQVILFHSCALLIVAKTPSLPRSFRFNFTFEFYLNQPEEPLRPNVLEHGLLFRYAEDLADLFATIDATASSDSLVDLSQQPFDSQVDAAVSAINRASRSIVSAGSSISYSL